MVTSKTSPPCRLAALGLASEGAVRMAPILGLPQLLRDHGLDPDAFIREQGCDPALFSDPDNTIAFDAVGCLLAHTAAVSGCSLPGLELGRNQGVAVLGAVGRAMRLAPNLGAALHCMILHMHLHDRGSVPCLWTNDDQALFGYTLYCSDVAGTKHIYDGAMAIAYNIIRELAGPRWRAAEVRFFRDRPDDIAPFRDHFKALLRFGEQHAAIVFPKDDLCRPCITADPDRYHAALRDLESLDAATGGGLADKVRRLLLSLFVSGAGITGRAPDRAAVASLLALHPRTLNRRLRAEGTSFADLLADARYDIARQVLRDTQFPVDDVGYLLGYAETASFIHAFRRWSGTTATRWREQHAEK